MERKARRAKRFGLQSKRKDTAKTDSQSDEDNDTMYAIFIPNDAGSCVLKASIRLCDDPYPQLMLDLLSINTLVDI